jgi:hypothetical protein
MVVELQKLEFKGTKAGTEFNQCQEQPVTCNLVALRIRCAVMWKEVIGR